jgi:hypothetical protein
MKQDKVKDALFLKPVPIGGKRNGCTQIAEYFISVSTACPSAQTSGSQTVLRGSLDTFL